MGRTILVGDIHGCAAEFDMLLEATRYAQGVDRLVLVGDLVARGPDSAKVVRRARALGAKAVRGNHDEKVLSWWRLSEARGRREADRRVPLSPRHRVVVEALDTRDFRFLDGLPLIVALPEHGAVVVHAGVDPAKRAWECSEDVLLTMRSVDGQGAISRRLDGTAWAKLYRGPEHVVFGHDARRNLQLEACASGLDTGCCYGRQLTAMVLDEGEPIPADVEARRAKLVQVQAREAYCPAGTGDGPE